MGPEDAPELVGTADFDFRPDDSTAGVGDGKSSQIPCGVSDGASCRRAVSYTHLTLPTIYSV